MLAKVRGDPDEHEEHHERSRIVSSLFANQGFDTAIIALVVALTAFVQQRVSQGRQSAQIEGIQNQQAKQPTVVVAPVPPAAVAPATVAVPSGGGVAALTVPAWSQTTDVAAGGTMSATGVIDCGYECVAMCLRIMTGVQVPAAYLRWLVKGPGENSLATADDLVAAFALNEHAAHRRDAPFDALKVEIGHSIAARKPAIVLGRWLSPEGHWMVVEQVDDARGVLFRDPWGGPQYWLPWPVVEQRYAGTYVHVDERATYAP